MLSPRLPVLLFLVAPLVSACGMAVQMGMQAVVESVVHDVKAKRADASPPPIVVVRATYQVSPDTSRLLKALTTGRAWVEDLAATAAEQSDCRAIGPVPIANRLSIPQFISKAMNDEFNEAGLHDPAGGVKLTGEITKIVLSTNPLLESGWWELAMRVRSDTGAEVSAEAKHAFQVDTDAHKACGIIAPSALGPATQVLLRNLVSQPAFASLLRR